MQRIEFKDLLPMFERISEIFADKKEELCEMDAYMGDGDLGLTMSKGFGALPVIIKENEVYDDIGKTLFKSAMKMSALVPSTMGTLMSFGLMEGAKTLNGKNYIEGDEFIAFLAGFEKGIIKIGKCNVGERTLLDSISEAVKEAKKIGNNNLEEVAKASYAGAIKGVEKTKEMLPRYGKAAVFADKAKGVADQGAVAGMYLIKGLHDFIIE